MRTINRRAMLAAFAIVGLVGVACSQSPDSNTSAGAAAIQNSQTDIQTPPSSIPQVKSNGTTIHFTTAQPMTVNGTVMVPVRDYVKQLGATLIWLPGEKKVIILTPTDQTLTLDTNLAWVLDADFDLLGRPERFAGNNTNPPTPQLGTHEIALIGNRAYMPIDQLATALNGTVDWDPATGIPNIRVSTAGVPEDTSPARPFQPTPPTDRDAPLPAANGDEDAPKSPNGPPSYHDEPTFVHADNSFLDGPTNRNVDDPTLTDGTNPGTGNPGTNAAGINVLGRKSPGTEKATPASVPDANPTGGIPISPNR